MAHQHVATTAVYLVFSHWWLVIGCCQSFVVAPCNRRIDRPLASPPRTKRRKQPLWQPVIGLQNSFVSGESKNYFGSTDGSTSSGVLNEINQIDNRKKRVLIIGAGWGGLSAAHQLGKFGHRDFEVSVVDAAPRVGGLVRDGFFSLNGTRPAEAGQHGFWDQYYNIFHLLDKELGILDTALTGYAEQGQYSKSGGLEAVWPVFKDQVPKLPTGLAQAAYTKFRNLPLVDRLTAFPLVLAFSEFDNSEEAWNTYDAMSFRDLCVKLGVSQRCYDEAFEPMILTGLFAPGSQVSAAAALGMAYFFVLQRQTAFDVRWCKGNIGQVIFDPWVQKLKKSYGIKFQLSTRVTGFHLDEAKQHITSVMCEQQHQGNKKEFQIQADAVIFAVGAAALNALVRLSPKSLGGLPEFQRFANLRGTSVLATRLFLNEKVNMPYTANACWGFDPGVGMTVFDIGTLHQLDFEEINEDLCQSIVEVDYYHANSLLVLSDEEIAKKAKRDLDCILGDRCRDAQVVDAAIVRLPNAVNWYFPESYKDMPNLKSQELANVYFSGDLVRTRHGSWSQEKAFVSGIQAANLVQGKHVNENVIPLPKDEWHVEMGRTATAQIRELMAFGQRRRRPSLVDFWF